MTNRITTNLDLNIGEQEVLQRILAQPDRIAKTLADGDVREEARMRDVLVELAGAFAQGLIEAMDRVNQAAERDQGRSM
ncbi:hypothetical protein YO5_18082 [Stutzerimonas stutzeri TS44]|nr:hypothetical protein YO5_18082 [Stutzerimonas stutzeri TS44]